MSEYIQKQLHSSKGYYILDSGDNNDEIDLFELLFKLWDKKRIILIVTFITTLIAGMYAFTAKERWTVKAYICLPRIAQFSDYLELRRAFSRVSGIDANSQDIAQNLFNNFISMAISPDEKLAYLSATDYVIKQTKNMDPQAKRIWLNEMTEKGLDISPPDEKKYLPYFTISVSADSPETAQNLLENYVQRINDKVMQQDDAEFRNNLEAMILARKKEQQDIEFSLKANRINQLTDLERTLSTAQRAGIKDYYANSASKGTTKIELANSVHKYMLGENFLSAEIKSLKESPIVYPVRYYDIEREISLLEPLLKQTVTAQVYRYQLSPGEYVKKDRPKKLLILVLGVLLGGMLGIGSVLISDGIASYRNNRRKGISAVI